MHKHLTQNSSWIGGVFTFLMGILDHFSPDDLSKIAIVCGITFTIISFFVNAHYKRKEFKLKEKVAMMEQEREHLMIDRLKDR